MHTSAHVITRTRAHMDVCTHANVHACVHKFFACVYRSTHHGVQKLESQHRYWISVQITDTQITKILRTQGGRRGWSSTPAFGNSTSLPNGFRISQPSWCAADAQRFSTMHPTPSFPGLGLESVPSTPWFLHRGVCVLCVCHGAAQRSVYGVCWATA